MSGQSLAVVYEFYGSTRGIGSQSLFFTHTNHKLFQGKLREVDSETFGSCMIPWVCHWLKLSSPGPGECNGDIVTTFKDL